MDHATAISVVRERKEFDELGLSALHRFSKFIPTNSLYSSCVGSIVVASNHNEFLRFIEEEQIKRDECLFVSSIRAVEGLNLDRYDIHLTSKGMKYNTAMLKIRPYIETKQQRIKDQVPGSADKSIFYYF